VGGRIETVKGGITKTGKKKDSKARTSRCANKRGKKGGEAQGSANGQHANQEEKNKRS